MFLHLESLPSRSLSGINSPIIRVISNNNSCNLGTEVFANRQRLCALYMRGRIYPLPISTCAFSWKAPIYFLWNKLRGFVFVDHFLYSHDLYV